MRSAGNSPASLSQLLHMTIVLACTDCKAYIDDVVCQSKARTSHIDDLAVMLRRFELAGISLKLMKCLWFTKSMPYLGHVVKANQGICVDPDKVQGITAIKACRTVTVGDVMSFLGVAVFYAKFISDFAAIANPLRQLFKKYKSKEASVTEDWSRDPTIQQSFDATKAAPCLAPVLSFPDFNRPWLLMTDASYGQIAAALCQMGSDGVEHPIAYASRMLTDTETRYGITSKEGLALVYAQRKFRC